MKLTGRKNGTVLLLAAGGMICWGIAPVFAKIGLGSVNPIVGLALRTGFTAGIISGWMTLSGRICQVRSIPLSAWLLIGIEAILATLVGDLAYFAAIKHGDVSLVSVIVSSSPLVTILCAVLFLGEQMTFTKLIGAGCIILGIVLIV